MSFNQFLDILEIEPVPSESSLERLFEKLDPSKKGCIHHESLYTDLTTRGDKLDGDVVRALLQNPDYNRDNKFYYREFCTKVMETSNHLKKQALERLLREEAELGVNSRTFKVKRKSSQPSPSKPHETSSVQADVHTSVSGEDGRDHNQNTVERKGCLYLEGEVVLSHQYHLNLDHQSNVHITIKVDPQHRVAGRVVDVALYIFDQQKRFIARSTLKSYAHGWKGTLEKGSYLIIPHTTGAVLRRRSEMKKNTRKNIIIRSPEIGLSPEFKTVLTEVFNMVDLDGSGSLSREEFNLFNWRTSGEEIADEEWEVVEENFPLKNGELSLEGFQTLHQMEAQDNNGDPGELWVTLSSMGYNNQLEQDGSASYTLVVSSSSPARLVVSGVKSGGLILEKTMIRSTMDGCKDPVKVPGSSNIWIYQQNYPDGGSVVIQNKAERNQNLVVDLSNSCNILSNRKSLKFNLTVGKKSSILAAHIIPLDTSKPWSLVVKPSLN